jgi:hypothetical protein
VSGLHGCGKGPSSRHDIIDQQESPADSGAGGHGGSLPVQLKLKTIFEAILVSQGGLPWDLASTCLLKKRKPRNFERPRKVSS